MTPLELTGRAETHLVALDDYRDGRGEKLRIHRDAHDAFLALCAAARDDGITIKPVSIFRGFAQQAAIWNAKARGERPLYTPEGKRLDYVRLSKLELMHAILRWSALPGSSRHHWGSDIDIIDSAAVSPDYRVQLLPGEFGHGGPFFRLGEWMREHLSDFGFFHPYRVDRGGVAPEPWHISYAGVSVPALSMLSPALIAEAVLENDLLLKDEVVSHLNEIEQRYIHNILQPEFIWGQQK